MKGSADTRIYTDIGRVNPDRTVGEENTMADITKCSTETCPLRYKCYRHMAKPTPVVQAWQAFKHRGNGTCNHFMSCKGRVIKANGETS
jgi:hypothetical protein